MKKFFDFSHFKLDAFGGITAGIVALPLALAFGEQSGLGASAGLYGAAFIAFFAALFGGTPTQISGPTAPMTALSLVIIGGLLQTYEGVVEDALPIILMVFILAGVFQIILGALKLGTYIKYIPYTVVSGFMTGIGVIIIISQLPLAFGYAPSEDAELVEKFKPKAEALILERILMEEAEDEVLVLEEFRETIEKAQEITPEHIYEEAKVLAANDAKTIVGSVKYLPRALRNINKLELILCLITIIIVFGFKRITTKVPSTLVALLAVSCAAFFMKLNYTPISKIPDGIPVPHFEIFSQFDLAALLPYIISALMLALLGAIDSLLTSVVADNMTKTQHEPNRELIGQGIGNSVAALFAGIPGAGATIRTVVNIQAGGRTKLSGMVAGLLLFLVLVGLSPLASKIPAAVLVGILITVGIGVMDYKGLTAFPRMEKAEKMIMITVLVLTVFWQLVYAVGIGLVMASVIFLKRMSDLSEEKVRVYDLAQTIEEEEVWEDEKFISPLVQSQVIIKHLSGPMFFGFATHFKNLLSDLGEIKLVVIRMKRVPFIDQSGVYALEASIDDLHNAGALVVITGANKGVSKRLHQMKIIPQIVREEHVFEQFNDSLVWMKNMLKKEDGLAEELKKIN